MRQADVDPIKFRALAEAVRHLLKKNGTLRGIIQHLWFPRDSALSYEIREGNPPADTDRPEHLRGLNLVVDSTVIPAHVRELLRPGGLLDQWNKEAELAHKPKMDAGMAMRMSLEVRREAKQRLITNENEIRQSYNRAAKVFELQRKTYT